MNVYKVLIVNGPNMNMLGRRETSVYGSMTLDEIIELTRAHSYGANVKIDHFQSNFEGDLIDRIQNARDSYDLIVINAGGLTHTSICLRDALILSEVPFVEVHISNIFAREDFREQSVTADRALCFIAGGGVHAYALGVMAGINHLKLRNESAKDKSLEE